MVTMLSTNLRYWVATGLQDTYLKLGLVIATAIAGAHILIGLGLFFLRARKVCAALTGRGRSWEGKKEASATSNRIFVYCLGQSQNIAV